MRVLLLASLLTVSLFAREPLAQRITHLDPAKYRKAQRAHAGAGELHYMTLVRRVIVEYKPDLPSRQCASARG